MESSIIHLTTTASDFIPYDMKSGVLWALILGIILAFLLGFGMGANDVANAFGTSVGSGVLSLKSAYILAIVFETLGAIFIGYNVADTMRKGVVSNDLFINAPKELLLGQVAILGGCSAWLLIATFAQLPVSTTHSITGATIGFGLVAKGAGGIQWKQVIDIVVSWFMSPVLSGIISCAIYMVIDLAVLRRVDSCRYGMRALPIFYWLCIAINAFAVSFQGSKLLHLSSLPWWACICISIVSATIVAILVHFVLIPRLILWIEENESEGSEIYADDQIMQTSLESVVMSDNSDQFLHPGKSQLWTIGLHDVFYAKMVLPIVAQKATKKSNPFILFFKSVKKFITWILPDPNRKIDQKTIKIFSSIQVLTACFAGFAHGANDVSNAIAPLTSLIIIYKDMDVMQNSETPIYALLFGVLAICCGLVALGHRVIGTVGTKMSHIDPISGFTIEFGAAVTTLLASKAGLPISTTHSLVGSVVAVGSIRTRKGVDWRIFRNIALSWIITLPVSGLISAGIMFLLKLTL